MTTEQITSLENKLKRKRDELEKYKKSIPKKGLFLFIVSFGLPFLPSRRRGGNLVEKLGYWDSVLFLGGVLFLVGLIGVYYQINSYKSDIDYLERNLERENLKNLHS